jgi:hypothetical protein
MIVFNTTSPGPGHGVRTEAGEILGYYGSKEEAEIAAQMFFNKKSKDESLRVHKDDLDFWGEICEYFNDMRSRYGFPVNITIDVIDQPVNVEYQLRKRGRDICVCIPMRLFMPDGFWALTPLPIERVLTVMVEGIMKAWEDSLDMKLHASYRKTMIEEVNLIDVAS